MKKFKKIYIEITNNCNLNCSFCSIDKREKKFMSKDEFELILKKIKDYTNYIYLHVKGEPLLHKDLKEFLLLADKYNIKVNITTNGTIFKNIVDDIKDIKSINKINFSLHCENNNEKYFDEIFTNVEKLPRNITIIYRLWTLENNKLDKKSTKIVDKIKEYYHLNEETVEKIYNENNIKISSTIYVDKNNMFSWPKIDGKEMKGYCYALKTHIAILVDGTVVPCCLDSDGIIKLGNIYHDNIEDIINSEKYMKLQKSFQDRNPCEKLCKNCTFKLKFNK